MTQIKRTDLFVISVACHSAVNRKIYRLFSDDGYLVEILLPKNLQLSGGIYSADPRQKDDPFICAENLIGTNSRFQLFQNQFKLLRQKKPKCILLDNDPISLNAVLLGVWCYFNHAKLFCISCENQPIGVLKNIYSKGFSSIASNLIKMLLSKFSVLLVDTVFTINDAGTKIFKELEYKNVIQMPLGFDPKIFHINYAARSSIRLKLGAEKYLIGFFGRVTREKGILILLEALSMIKDLEWMLLMDEFSQYQNDFNKEVDDCISRLGLSSRMIFANPKHVEMGEYINAVDLVVMPSVSTKKWVEQYGRIAAESMACGKLVVASNSGALPMLIDRHGIIFDEGNIHELRKIIRSVLKSKKLITEQFDPSLISQYAIEKLSIYRQKKIMQEHLFGQ